MTLEKARQLLATQVRFGGICSRDSVQIGTADTAKDHAQTVANARSREFCIDQLFGFVQGRVP
jgi:hypothetical protein